MKLLKQTLIGSAMLILLAACGGETQAPAAGDDGWQTLLASDNLDGWATLGDANWRFEDGAIVADQSSDPSYIVTEETYSDYELELDFWVDTDANSGVFIRCANPGEITDTSCYEVNIFDTRPDQTYRTGGIVNIAAPAEFIYTGGQWNSYRIVANGPSLQVELNGRALVDVEDSQLSSGPIALQYGTGIVKFRNVRLRSL
jgi:hypothetical protein